MLLVFAVMFTYMPKMAFADETKAKEDLAKIESYFKDKTGSNEGYIIFTTASTNNSGKKQYGDLVKFGSGLGEYTNAFTYLRDKAAALTNRNPSEIKVTGNASIMKGGYANGTPFEGKTMDEKGEFTQPRTDDFTTPAIMKPKFEIEGKSIECGTFIYFAVEPVKLTDKEKVDFEASTINWDAIKGKNTTQDNILEDIRLELKEKLYKVEFKTELKYLGNGTDPGALTIYGTQIKVKRPNVNEEDAKYQLIIKLTRGSEEKDLTFDLTVPAFTGKAVKFVLNPKDVELAVKDPYYGNKEVDKKYVTSSDGNLTYLLHEQKYSYIKYSWEAKKAGYITQTGEVSVAGGAVAPININLQKSDENDACLKSLELTSPPKGDSTIIEPMEAFSMNKLGYTLTVGSSVEYIDFAPVANVEGASILVEGIKYASDVDSGEETEDKNTKCFLKKAGDTKIQIKVTAPESSTQTGENREKTYTITVKKDSTVYPLSEVNIEAIREKGEKDNRAVPAEEVFSLEVKSGGHSDEYVSYVNSSVDSIKLSPGLAENIKPKEIQIDEKKLILNDFPYEKKLKTGLNEINAKIKYEEANQEKSIDYKFIIIKKQKLVINNIEMLNGSFRSKDGERIITSLFNAKDGFAKFKLDIDDDVTVTFDDNIPYRKGEIVTLDSAGSEKIIKIATLKRKVSDNGRTWEETQTAVISFYGTSPDYPTDVVNYLPAPGQFVNQEAYCNALATKAVTNGNMVTLGAYGGSIIYHFKDGIKNDPKNPYGIDFIVYGNAFTNDDGTSCLGAAEPAAVMVSSDGVHWAELAGSLFYDGKTKHNNKVKYTNADPSFSKGAKDVEWVRNDKAEGKILANSHHSQPYYPNPSIYDKYNADKFKNTSYNSNSMTVEGWSWISDKPAPRYGYGDTHANKEMNGKVSNEAVNPYAQRHDAIYNGDGMDLSWAVGADGTPINPAYVSTIYWVKIYNPNMYDGGTIGECSPEIVGAAIAKPDEKGKVGKSSGLKSLKINGEEVNIPSYGNINFDAKGNDMLVFEPTAEEGDSNILINDAWVKSGSKSDKLNVSSKARIIVQQGKKEPKIYTLDFSNVPTIEANVQLQDLILLPQGTKLEVNSEGEYEYKLTADIKNIKVKALPVNPYSKVQIDGENVDEKTGDWTSKSITIEKNKTVKIKVLSEDGSKNNEYKLNLTKEENKANPQPPENDNIKVSFELIGDDKHYVDENNHGKHNPTVWIKKTIVEIPKNSTIKYLTDSQLLGNGLDFITKNKGTYISKIQIPGSNEYLGEFDNGPDSGWMYRHNGKIANEGYASRLLQDGDKIKWFYTDDYKKEKGYEGNWDEVNSGSSSGGTAIEKQVAETLTVSTEIKPETKLSADGKSATAKVDTKTIETQIKKLETKKAEAKKDGKNAISEIAIDAKGTKNADKISTEIPKESMQAVVNNADILTVKTDVANVALDKNAIKKLANAGSDVTVAVEKNPSNSKEITVKATSKNGEIKNLTGEVKVPYAKPAGEKAEAVVVYKIDENGNKTIVPTAGLSGNEMNIKGTEISGKFEIAYNEKSFEDISANWAKGEITYLAAREVVKGKGEGTFAPNAEITRAEFVQILANLSGDDISAKSGAHMGDVTEADWYNKAVGWAMEKGITAGDGTGKFNPNANITRQEMAVMLDRYLKNSELKLTEKAKAVTFKDNHAIASYADAAIASMQKLGVINGVKVGDGYEFKPTAEASRAEASKMIYQLIK